MIAYMTEEEQLAAIKKWWMQHSTKITLVLSVLMLFVGGYRYWQWHQEKVTIEASNTYERMLMSLTTTDNPSVQAYAHQLITQHKKTIYADAARLILAKTFIDSQKPDQAKTMLNEVSQSSSLPAFRQIAKIRLARLLLSEKHEQQALSLLDKLEDPSYISMVNEVKGDIYVALNKIEEAKQAYKVALNENEKQSITDLFLELKMKALGIELTTSLEKG